jgi:pimeloyl-ACP methyl ester carboxylesterase
MRRPDTVVLVHGLWVHGIVMMLMQHRIERAGYRVIRYSYPSMRLTLTENVERFARFVRTLGEERLHFVGHSLGGLVVLRTLLDSPPAHPGRIVLLGTPFAECFSAHRLVGLPGGATALGRSMAQWLAEPRPNGLQRLDIGAIAGTLSIGLGRLIASDLPRPNDGVVCVSETRIPGMRDHVVVRASHTTLVLADAVNRQVCAYLDRGQFDRSAP